MMMNIKNIYGIWEVYAIFEINGNLVTTHSNLYLKKGECRWERDGDPVGIYPTKYEWSGNPEDGDCSLKILDSSLEFDDGVWQCQVTPTNFLQKDSLISEGAQLVVRGKP